MTVDTLLPNGTRVISSIQEIEGGHAIDILSSVDKNGNPVELTDEESDSIYDSSWEAAEKSMDEYMEFLEEKWDWNSPRQNVLN